ncbi:prepilin-type N-terminal cleavage/methylation domain-containing protein [Chitinispirillales bacterium ANBcel5]|uniref:PulJ/GspJ family protein n=1 Tax=Cellulosispirillum alkaliphilum TaxID=3039283 RepID=UPI002A4E3FF4|nr:prepilin-type N-terminal cleavage/methylation domain-containing protein [Chitinispirillales bacterium ANBcel5]
MCRAGNNRGITILELIISMFISSVVISGAYRLYNDLSKRMDHEAESALVYTDLITVSSMIERDFRVAGYNLPGNGIKKRDENGIAELLIFTNQQNVRTAAASQTQAGERTISLHNTDGFSVGDWICITAMASPEYHQISAVGTTGTITIEQGVSGTVPAGSLVYKADGVRYYIDEEREALFREMKGNSYLVSNRIEVLELVAKDTDGQIITGDFSQTRAVSISLGSVIRSAGTERLVTESTEVNIRNVNL